VRLIGLLLALACSRAPEPPPAPARPAEGDLEGRREEINSLLDGLVEDLEKAGRYDCCIQVPCRHCARMAGGCSCGEGLRRGEPVCEECALMWKRGQGAEAGVKPNSVRSFLEMEHWMDRRYREEMCAEPGPTATP
jgi:hypothetical protein